MRSEKDFTTSPSPSERAGVRSNEDNNDLFTPNNSFQKPNYQVGSNNWAVGGSKTQSGYPILCGDPHLHLTLPSIWYQVQLTCNGKSVNGASLPGAPGVIIGFNDSCAWSMTNAERDVKNFYHIKFKDATQQEYWLDNHWAKTEMKIENIFVRGKGNVLDTVFYTVFGPVQYDKGMKLNNKIENLAVNWMGHYASNELMTIYLLNRANNFSEYDKAISYFQSPGQNFVFACKNKDIAIWEQGRFAVLQPDEGKFILEGNNSKLAQHQFIPHEQNPHILNPERGFVSSANQQPTDKTYPYNYYGDYYEYRSLDINNYLENSTSHNIASMEFLQKHNYSLWVEDFDEALKIIFPNVLDTPVSKLAFWRENLRPKMNSEFYSRISDRNFAKLMFEWDRENFAKNESTTFFNLWYDALTDATFNDEFQHIFVSFRKTKSRCFYRHYEERFQFYFLG